MRRANSPRPSSGSLQPVIHPLFHTPGGGREYRAAVGWSGAQAVYRLTHVEHRELVDLYLRTGPFVRNVAK